MKLYLAQINTNVGDLEGNSKKILSEFKKANSQNCDLIIFPEMSICGYPCEDLWLKKYFIEECKKTIQEICAQTKSFKTAALIGFPMVEKERNIDVIRNSVALISNGEIKKTIHKKSLPNFGVFDEERYFKSANFLSNFEFKGFTIAVIICEDLWHVKNLYLMQEQVFDLLIVVNSSPYLQNKKIKREQAAELFAKNLKKPLIYVNQIGGQDSLVFDGSSFVLNGDGKKIFQMKSFCEDSEIIEVSKDGEVKNNQNLSTEISSKENENYQACVLGLRDYIYKNNFKKVLLGMSGGIDSALVATIAVDALGFENVSLYALPSKYNSLQSMIDAKECANNLSIELKVIEIEGMVEKMLSSIENLSQIAKENIQSRLRGNILMSISNSDGSLLLSTGNKSELACGYATIYGDMCGSFNPIKDLYKTEVFQIAKWRNKNIPEISFFQKKNLIPQNILTKPPTAELRENQKDSDSLPEYEILDKILFFLIEEDKSINEIIKIGFDEDLVKKIAKLFYNSEYKRRQSVIGCKLSEKSFDKDRRYPITNKFTI
jgi:NAD+ synthase